MKVSLIDNYQTPFCLMLHSLILNVFVFYCGYFYENFQLRPNLEFLMLEVFSQQNLVYEGFIDEIDVSLLLRNGNASFLENYRSCRCQVIALSFQRLELMI